jgi:poly-beta-hydroxyalkanoate depolymerase
MGEKYIDNMIKMFGHTVSDEHVGVGRKCFDGRLQVLGFYLLGMDQHMNNFKKLLSDLKKGNRPEAERQMAFYQWYNYAHHFPASFVRDTYKKIFIRNELIHGTLNIGGRAIGIKDYPAGTPIWAIGGSEDKIAPPLQATGHMNLIDNVAPENKLTLICKGGHMALFRSGTVLRDYYSQIVRFLLEHSDRKNAV